MIDATLILCNESRLKVAQNSSSENKLVSHTCKAVWQSILDKAELLQPLNSSLHVDTNSSNFFRGKYSLQGHLTITTPLRGCSVSRQLMPGGPAIKYDVYVHRHTRTDTHNKIILMHTYTQFMDSPHYKRQCKSQLAHMKITLVF